MAVDPRRKIQFYVNPEENDADRKLCELIDSLPTGERGRHMRQLLMVGLFFRDQNPITTGILSELAGKKITRKMMAQQMEIMFPTLFIQKTNVDTTTPEAAPGKDLPKLSNEEKRGFKDL